MSASRATSTNRSVVVRPSPVHGRGVFATADHRRGAVVDSGHVLVLPVTEPRAGDHLERYVFAFDRTRTCVLLGAASLCNHCTPANVEVEIDLDRRTYRLLATRPIRRGEELLLDYGDSYWPSSPTPGEA
jgi:hypothetical protein